MITWNFMKMHENRPKSVETSAAMHFRKQSQSLFVCLCVSYLVASDKEDKRCARPTITYTCSDTPSLHVTPFKGRLYHLCPLSLPFRTRYGRHAALVRDQPQTASETELRNSAGGGGAKSSAQGEIPKGHDDHSTTITPLESLD